MKLADVIEELVEERGLDRVVLGSIICEGMLAAYQKKYPDLVLRVEYNKKTDERSVCRCVEGKSKEGEKL